MTSLTLGSLRRERSSTLRALRPCCINDLWLRFDCRICRPRNTSETTTAMLLASDARSARLMDDMTILARAPRTAIRNRTARSFRSASNETQDQRPRDLRDSPYGQSVYCKHSNRTYRVVSRSLHRLVRRYHAIKGESPARRRGSRVSTERSARMLHGT